MNTQFSFEELRSFLRESDKGKLVDSLMAVEFGLEFYEVSWLAHQDYLEQVSEESEDFGPTTFAEVATLYLLDMSDEIGFAEIDFDKIAESAQ